jgi:hypothetical protein
MTRRRERTFEELTGKAPRRGAGRPVADHRQQLVLAQAEGQRLKNEKLAGSLLPAADVEAAWASAFADARARFLALPPRFAATHGLGLELREALDADLRAILASLAASQAPP